MSPKRITKPSAASTVQEAGASREEATDSEKTQEEKTESSQALELYTEPDSPPAVPSPIKRKFLALTEQRQSKRSPVKQRGVRLTKCFVDSDFVAFSVEGMSSNASVCLLSRHFII